MHSLVSPLVASLLLTASASAGFPAGKMYETVKVGEGIYAFVSPESKTAVVSGNVVAIVGDDAVLVIDSGRRARVPGGKGQLRRRNAVSPD